MSGGTDSKSNTKERQSIANRIKRIPLFWKYLTMMGAVLLLAVLVLSIINKRNLDTLSRELLSERQSNLNHNCDKLDAKFVSVVLVPQEIENSRMYRYIAGKKGTELEKKYYPILSFLQDQLVKQKGAISDVVETVLYLRDYNSVISSTRYEPVAEDFFRKWAVYSEAEIDTVIDSLATYRRQSFIPMQEIRVKESVECLSVILQPVDCTITIMNLYSKETILEQLGLSNLPEGSFWELVDQNGAVVASSQTGPKKTGKMEIISGSLNSFGAVVRVGIPRSYFNDMMRENVIWSMAALILTFLVGIALAVLFSRISVRPIQKLIRTHGGPVSNRSIDELSHLDQLLAESKENENRMQLRLRKQILSKVFYGGVLSGEEEDHLKTQLPYLESAYQLAVFHTSSQVNAVVSRQLEPLFPDGVWTMLSPEETGFLFESDTENRLALSQFVHQMNLKLEGTGISCGISAPAVSISELNTAARQAKRALPSEPGLSVYHPDSFESNPVYWLWHERLYQYVLNADEEGALGLLNQMANESLRARADELFSVIRFVLQNAAAELDVVIPPDEVYEYSANLSREGNIRNLGLMIRWIVSSVRKKKEAAKSDLQNEVMEYLGEHLADSELTAATVAEEFGMMEKRIYEIVRSRSGKSFKEYLTDLRMKKASKLLYTTTEDIADVAAHCGYNNISTFYRQFQNYFGIAPGSFRKSSDALSKAGTDGPDSH